MENLCIRIRFSPLTKQISKTGSKFCLEIVPLVSCIENFDKIKWERKNDNIEYIIPMNYKIIIRKLKPNDHAIKMFYSCVDLLPPSLSKIDLAAGEVWKVISENLMIQRDKNDSIKITNEPQFDIKLNTPSRRKKSRNSIVLYKEDSLIAPEITENQPAFLVEEIRADENKITQHPVNIISSERSTSNHNDLWGNLILTNEKKLTVPPVYQNMKQTCTENISLLDKLRSNSMVSLFHELDVLKYYNINMRKNRSLALSSNHKRESPNEFLVSHARIQPAERVARFVEKMEQEILPLKIILNNIIGKCLSLGLRNTLSNTLLGNALTGLENNKRLNLQKEANCNRVVYSIVFDE